MNNHQSDFVNNLEVMMATSLSVAVGAPHEFNLHGEIVQIYPLTFSQIGRLERIIRQEVMLASEDLLAAERDEKRRAAILAEATMQALKLSIGQDEVYNGVLMSIGLSLRIIQMSLSNDPTRLKPIVVADIEQMLGGDYTAMKRMAMRAWTESFVAYDDDGKPKSKNVPVPVAAVAGEQTAL